MSRPEGEPIPIKTADMLVAAITNDPIHRDYDGNKPPVKDLRNVERDPDYVKIFTSHAIAERVDELLSQSPESHVLSVDEDEREVTHLGQKYKAVTRVARTIHRLPVSSRTTYEPIGVGEFHAKERGVFRPYFTLTLCGVHPDSDQQYYIELTKYMGPDGSVDVYRLPITPVYSQIYVGDLNLRTAVQKRIADLFEVKY